MITIVDWLLWITSVIICSIFWYKYRKANYTKNLLIKQNLVYLVTFTNYFEWVSSSFKDNLVKVVAQDPELLEFFKVSGTSITLFLKKFEHPAVTVHKQMIEQSNAVLNDIKKPLAKEITELIDLCKDGYV